MDGDYLTRDFSMSGYEPTERLSFNGEKIWEKTVKIIFKKN
jgi:hypothetical protein